MGEQREHKQLISIGDYDSTIIKFFYYPQSDRSSCVIHQIKNDELIKSNLNDAEIRSIISIYQELKFTREIKKVKKEASFCFEIWDKSGGLIAVIDSVESKLSMSQMAELMKIFKGDINSESYYHVEGVEEF